MPPPRKHYLGCNLTPRTAFTLAEVLITLGIIGVVAALTIPTLISDYKEKVIVSKVKKMYTTLSNAYQLAILDYGTAGEWGITGRDAGRVDENWDNEETYNAVNAILIRDRVLKNVKKLNICNNSKNHTACGFEKVYYLNGDEDKNFDKYASTLLADGSSIGIVSSVLSNAAASSRGNGELSRVYANIVYDVNGTKPPNTYSKDIFLFYLTEHSIIPCGTTNETTFSFEGSCLGNNNGTKNGLACSAWVIYNENMDYLKCNNLSWNGKHKCD